MQILWVTNGVLPQIAAKAELPVHAGATWLVSVLDALLSTLDCRVTVLCNHSGAPISGRDGALAYATFSQDPVAYSAENERFFFETLSREKPDIVHVWGVEYPSALAMLRACRDAGLVSKTVVSIQGLCGVYAGHYAAGLPASVVYGTTLRDFLRRDNIAAQQRKYATRGGFEREALGIAEHVIGRTDWDFACTRQINETLTYHRCNETLRAPFYEGSWSPDGCRRHTLFLPQSYYPVKGTHFALEALAILRREFPDARLITTGDDPRSAGLRRSSYAKYIAGQLRTLGLTDAVTFLGVLNADEMKAQYLAANVCVSPSTIENSPNGVGEAMLLGVPTVASDVGGVASILTHRTEGYLYPLDEPYLLAEYARRIFLDDALASRLSKAAQTRAKKTHDRAQNLADLLSIYETVAGGQG